MCHQCPANIKEESTLGKKNKSKRFVQQGSDAVMKHDEKIPYHLTLAEAEALKQKNDSTLGGF
jgi:hypothetical protein